MVLVLFNLARHLFAKFDEFLLFRHLLFRLNHHVHVLIVNHILLLLVFLPLIEIALFVDGPRIVVKIRGAN